MELAWDFIQTELWRHPYICAVVVCSFGYLIASVVVGCYGLIRR